jgi:hypothetical protein
LGAEQYQAAEPEAVKFRQTVTEVGQYRLCNSRWLTSLFDRHHSELLKVKTIINYF